LEKGHTQLNFSFRPKLDQIQILFSQKPIIIELVDNKVKLVGQKTMAKEGTTANSTKKIGCILPLKKIYFTFETWFSKEILCFNPELAGRQLSSVANRYAQT
jgi:hypothetical protein